MANLAAIRDRLEVFIRDSTNAIWASGDLDEALREALHLYSQINPLAAWGTVTLASDTRELDVSALTGIFDVLQVWLPYTAADPEYPPNARRFEYWHNELIVYVNEGSEPQSGDVARVRYLKPHTIEDLDSATATSLPTVDESLLLLGAAGLAATSRSLDVVEEVTLGTSDAPDLQVWGEAVMSRFNKGLEEVRDRLSEQTTNTMVDVFPPDRWAARGGQWV